MQGYIKIDRSILYHPALYKRGQVFCEKGAFLWLLLEASFVDRKYRIKDKEIYLKRGQLCCSLSYMAEAWGWDKSKVQRFLDKLKQFDTITTDTLSDTPIDTPNILTICHYDKYQDTPNDTPTDNKHNKRNNKDNKYILDMFDEFWSKVKRKVSKGKSEKAFKKLDREWIERPSELADLYNQHCASKDDIKFSQHPSTWLNGKGFEDTIETSEPVSISQHKNYKNYVFFVKKGIRTTAISDDMVRKMYQEELITEQEYKNW
tara:strand:- start:1900 stop:2682 length:783 start_codon:yes stop_codon:yes gene_type:complete